MKAGTREMVAMLLHTHRAWLIEMVGEQSVDRPSNECFDAASSLADAKRIAREAASDWGYVGTFRWERETFGWSLHATWPEDE